MGLAIGLLLGAILLLWLGTRHRKKVYAEYEDDSQKYTATTTMTLIKQTKSETQRWEDKGDGNQELVTDICYLPTYEYTVNGEVYHYTSRHGSDTVQKPGMQRTGYYEPSNPKNITEYQPQKPVLGAPSVRKVPQGGSCISIKFVSLKRCSLCGYAVFSLLRWARCC